jgi:hypothetical protein
MLGEFHKIRQSFHLSDLLRDKLQEEVNIPVSEGPVSACSILQRLAGVGKSVATVEKTCDAARPSSSSSFATLDTRESIAV